LLISTWKLPLPDDYLPLPNDYWQFFVNYRRIFSSLPQKFAPNRRRRDWIRLNFGLTS
jgi:hypothetical protein